MKIAFTGGSSGGHVMPIQSLIKYIKTSPEFNDKFSQILWFGENDSMEERVCTDLNTQGFDVQFHTVISGKIRREKTITGIVKNSIDMILFIWGVLIMIIKIPRYHIDVIFCKGGFVSLPLTIAGWFWSIPIFVHESDTKPGIATKLCSYFATRCFSGFDGVLKNSITVGQIMSSDLIKAGSYHYGDPHKTNLLITGGSLGAKTMYEAILQLQKENNIGILNSYNIILILGSLNQDMRTQFEGRAYVFDRADQITMGSLYQRADICICRGGTTTLAELELFGVHKIIIPLPITHDQQTNAEYYVNHHKDTLIKQDEHITNNIHKALEYYQGYHKESIDTNKLHQNIDFAKEIIMKNICNLKNR